MGAKCGDPDRMFWGTIGAGRLPALAASPLFAALVLDASAEMDAFWRAVAQHAAAHPAAANTGAPASATAAAAPAGTALVPAAGPAAGAAAAETAVARGEVLAALAARARALTLHKQARYE